MHNHGQRPKPAMLQQQQQQQQQRQRQRQQSPPPLSVPFSSSRTSSAALKTRDSLGSALAHHEKGPVTIKEHLKRTLTALFQHYGQVLTTEQVLEYLPHGTSHSVNESEQRKIFKKVLKAMATNRKGVWYCNSK